MKIKWIGAKGESLYLSPIDHTSEKGGIFVTKQEMRNTMLSCIDPHKLCRVFMKYDQNYFYYFPLKVNDHFFLGVKEEDFILNGYCIRRCRDVVKVEVRDDICLAIAIKEGTIDKIVMPDIDITNWQTIFTSLEKFDRNIIVEQESLNEEDCRFAIGKIEGVNTNFMSLRHFDGDGVWQDKPWKLHYTKITSVTFASRYVDIFSKYLPQLPSNFGK